MRANISEKCKEAMLEGLGKQVSIVKEDGKNYIKYDSISVSNQTGIFVVKFYSRGLEVINMAVPGGVNFSEGEALWLIGLDGRQEFSLNDT